MTKTILKVFSANEIADYFILKAYQDKKPLTNKKMQKLLYYAQAWTCAIRKHKLFREDIEAWIHGPAIYTVYSRFKKYGFAFIDLTPKDSIASLIGDTAILDDVWKIYGKFDDRYLEELTHNEAPWQEARRGLEQQLPSRNVISLTTMDSYYSGLLTECRKK
jgi:uncharacterized phage-associated protein